MTDKDHNNTISKTVHISKTRSIGAQLKRANAEIAEHKLHIETLTKKLAEAEKSKDEWYKRYSEKDGEISQVHTLLDSVPNPPPSTLTDNSYAKLNVLTRLSVFFATRNQGPTA